MNTRLYRRGGGLILAAMTVGLAGGLCELDNDIPLFPSVFPVLGTGGILTPSGVIGPLDGFIVDPITPINPLTPAGTIGSFGSVPPINPRPPISVVPPLDLIPPIQPVTPIVPLTTVNTPLQTIPGPLLIVP